ncbi:cobalamin biosynthesis protein [Celeribacter indicus]|uniref:Precorrin methylase n=1 Tax=Celeribacter indicus TaxID=1208324 RepID=A0A0B5DVL9_9RHOB|nr:cobalamin biosynthesis protein [Celeribacter indicus]AJE45200.1 precorrin methylase [Celeribacter indicus]SDX45161.1 cobalt-precorrin 5A hydrolase [Celeribacter indicus]
MRVAGIGFRAQAPLAALREAVAALGDGIDALATSEDKAAQPQARALAAALGLPLLAIPARCLASQSTPTRSPRVQALYGTGSLAEAAALAACGTGARLLTPRRLSCDRTASAALAEGADP